mgnify:CR=1 FL=1
MTGVQTCALPISCCFLCLGGEGGLLLLLLKEIFDGCNIKLGVAILAGHVVVTGQEREGGAAVGALVADTCVGHVGHLFYGNCRGARVLSKALPRGRESSA